MNKIGIVYHPKLEAARQLAEELRALAAQEVTEVWIGDAWDERATHEHTPGTDLLVCVGGDGTVLRGARATVPYETLLLGVNMGRLGFLTELDPEGAVARLPDVIRGEGRIESRAMLRVEARTAAGEAHFHALNDAVVGRASLGHTVHLAVAVNGTPIADLRADGLIVATATGSSAYSLSAGGPILHPESKHVLLTPLAPHMAARNSMVLPPESTVTVRLADGQAASLSVDGEANLELSQSDEVEVTLSPHVARFVRLSDPAEFLRHIAQRLGWLRAPSDREGEAAARFSPALWGASA
jgi:NAD+ kinase